MPTPLELLINPVTLIILAMYASLMIWEALKSGRQLPVVKYWRVRGLVAFVLYFYLASYLPLIWDSYLAQFQLINLSGAGLVPGVIVGVLVYEFGVYVWHRAMHKNNTLWKVFHQMHHSAERLDTFGAFYFSPYDMIGFTLLGSISLVLIVGLAPEAATITILIINFLGIFQHTNIKTPRWLGYIVQRPESHTIHHAKGIHGFNYSDLPIFDIIFGTFKNPDKYEHETGLYAGASMQILDMISFKELKQRVNNQ